jgi:cell division septation protein DedD
MRFEIRAGGVFLILVGLIGLSGVVFALGLVAGYEMARQTAPEPIQAAGVYPLPSQPEASPAAQASPAQAMNASAASPVAAASPAAEKPTAMSLAPAGVASAAPKPSAAAVARASASPRVVAAPKTLSKPVERTFPPPAPAPVTAKAETSAPPPPPRVSEPASPPAVTARPSTRVGRAAEEPVHRKPYNIQIDAVMDRANAAQMADRLQKLGYNAFLVPTIIGGQTWWRVRVGPYDSEEEATEAEEHLREEYRAAYAGTH